MTPNRRSVLAAAAMLAVPGAVLAAKPRKTKRPKACKGRAAYAGPALRAQLTEAQFDAAAKAGAARLAPTVSERFEDRFAEAVGQLPKAQAITAALATPDGLISTQTHAADRAAPLPSRFFWASVGKAYAATAILQMVEDGKLSLATTLDRWSPETPNAAWITVEDLLCHTGGIYSFQSDPGLRAAPGYKPPEQLLAAANVQPAAFCPGLAWSYSNTGYVHLGRIIEAVDGRPYHQSLQRRIVERLELRETDILAPRQVVAGLAPPAPSGATSGTDDDITTPFAAAGVAASAGDVVRFWRALMSNRLHGEATTRRRFLRLYPMAGVGPSHYGLGVMVSDLAGADPRATDTWLGHAGGLPGAKAVVAYSLEKQAFVAVALTGEGSPEATANLLLRDLPKVG